MEDLRQLQCNNCPLVWMIRGRKANAKLNKFCERALRITCKYSGDNSASNLNKSLTIHKRNLQLHMIALQKISCYIQICLVSVGGNRVD